MPFSWAQQLERSGGSLENFLLKAQRGCSFFLVHIPTLWNRVRWNGTMVENGEQMRNT